MKDRFGKGGKPGGGKGKGKGEEFQDPFGGAVPAQTP